MAGYIHKNDKVEWDSLKEEIKAIKEAFLNPLIVIAGDLNEAFNKMANLEIKRQRIQTKSMANYPYLTSKSLQHKLLQKAIPALKKLDQPQQIRIKS